MPHVLSMFDSQYLHEFDLLGKDVIVEIDRVVQGNLTAQGGRTQKKPVVYFKGKERGLALNKTNARTIISMYGTATEDWVGKLICLFPTQTQFGSETKPCIRVRPTVPKRKAKRAEPEPSHLGDGPISEDEAAEIARMESETVQ